MAQKNSVIGRAETGGLAEPGGPGSPGFSASPTETGWGLGAVASLPRPSPSCVPCGFGIAYLENAAKNMGDIFGCIVGFVFEKPSHSLSVPISPVACRREGSRWPLAADNFCSRSWAGGRRGCSVSKAPAPGQRVAVGPQGLGGPFGNVMRTSVLVGSFLLASQNSLPGASILNVNLLGMSSSRSPV